MDYRVSMPELENGERRVIPAQLTFSNFTMMLLAFSLLEPDRFAGFLLN